MIYNIYHGLKSVYAGCIDSNSRPLLTSFHTESRNVRAKIKGRGTPHHLTRDLHYMWRRHLRVPKNRIENRKNFDYGSCIPF